MIYDGLLLSRDKTLMEQNLDLTEFIDFITPVSFSQNYIDDMNILIIPHESMSSKNIFTKFWWNVFFKNEVFSKTKNGFKILLQKEQSW